MITADDLTELRGAGKSDDDILKDYREFDPQYNNDIDELLKTGRSPKDILDDLAEFSKTSKPATPDRMADKGVLAKAGGALQYGASQALAGLGSTAKHAGWQGGADALARGAKSVAPADYDPAGSKFDVTDPSTYGYAPRALLEGAPGLAADLASGAVGGAAAGPVGALAGFTLSNSGRNFGNNVDERLQHQGPGAQVQTSDYLAAGASTATEALLSRVGLNPALGSVTKGAGVKAMAQLPGLIAKASGAEAAAGAAGNLVNQVGRTAGTEDGLSVDAKEIGNNAALSGATGGAIRAARGAGDLTNSIRFAGMDDAAASRVVERLDRHSGDTKNAKAAYETVSVARKTLDTEINDANQVIRPLLRSRGNDTDTDSLRVLLKDTITTLKAGAEAPEDALPSLKDRLGTTSEGDTLVKLLEERQALNKLLKSGNFDTKEKTFAGGIADTSIGRNILDPRAIYRNKILGGGTAAGVAGLSAAGQAAALAPVAGKVLAGQVGAYTTARLIDKATGLRNPAGEFMQRFRGQGDQAPSDAPSYRQMAQDAQATSQTLRKAQGSEQARAKQEDRAWKAKAAEDERLRKEAERQEAEMDKAWASREPKEGLKEGQEEALWRQHEAEATRVANEDAQASQGISEGYRALLEKAVKAGLAERKARELAEGQRAKDTEAAYKARGKADAEDAKRQSEMDKAWASKEPGKTLSEDDLWSQYETQRTKEGADDLEAEAGIAQGYKALAAQAKKSAEIREGQIKKAETQRTQQDREEQRIRDTARADYGKAEAQRRAKTPEQTKAEQEDAMWRSQEAPASQDWSEDDALSAIRAELSGRQKASEALVKLSKKDAEAKKKAEEKEAQSTAKAQAKAIATAAKAAEKAPKLKAEEPKAKTNRERLEDAYFELTGGATNKAIRLKDIRAKLSDIPRDQLDAELKAILGGDETGTMSQFSDPKSLKAEDYEAGFSPAGERYDILRFSAKTQRATPEQQPQAEPLQIKVKPSSIESNPETIRITHGDQVVERPVEGIRNVNAYTAKTKSRMETRAKFAEEIQQRAGSRQKPYVDAMLGKLNNSAKSFEDAYSVVEDVINDLPSKAQSELWDIWNKHEGKLKATYDR